MYECKKKIKCEQTAVCLHFFTNTVYFKKMFLLVFTLKTCHRSCMNVKKLICKQTAVCLHFSKNIPIFKAL